MKCPLSLQEMIMGLHFYTSISLILCVLMLIGTRNVKIRFGVLIGPSWDIKI